MLETRVWSLGREDPLEKEMVSNSSILAWRIPWTKSLVGYSPRGCKESDTTEWLHLHLHVHRVSDAIQPSHPLSSLLFLPPIPPRIRVFSNESTLHMRWPKYWSSSFSTIPSKEHTGLISLEWTGWITLQSKGFSRVFSNTTVQKHQLFGAQLSSQSNSHFMTTGKTIALTRQTFFCCCWQSNVSAFEYAI